MPDVEPPDRDERERLSSLLASLHEAIEASPDSAPASDLVPAALEAVALRAHFRAGPTMQRSPTR